MAKPVEMDVIFASVDSEWVGCKRGVLLVSLNEMIRKTAWLALAAVGLSAASGAQTPAAQKANASSMLKSRPTSFTQNKGQWNTQALFYAHGSNVDFWVTQQGFTFNYLPDEKAKSSKYAGHAIGMQFDGAQKFEAVGIDSSGTRQYIGKKNVTTKNFRKVQMKNVYSGVDAVAYFDSKTPRYDFVVKPGGKVDAIKLAFKGASGLKAKGKKLTFETVFGARTQEGLFAYQLKGDKKVPVEVNFKQLGSEKIGFEVGKYDAQKALYIDPLVYGSYYGGDNGFDEVRGVAADTNGSVYLTGYTRSPNYPVLSGPFGFNAITTGDEAFVSRLQGDAYNHDYSAIITGNFNERGNFIQLDPMGNVWVCGNTNSTNFPNATSSATNTLGAPLWVMRFAPSTTNVLDPFSGSSVAGEPVVWRFGGSVGAPTGLNVTSFSIASDLTATNTSEVRMLFTGACSTAGMAPLPLTANRGSYFMQVAYNPTTNLFNVPAGAGDYIQATPGAAAVTGLSITGGSYDPSGNVILNGTIVSSTNSDTAVANPVFQTTSGIFAGGRLQRKSDIWVRKYSNSGSLIWSGLVGGSGDDFTQGFLLTGRVAGGARGTDISGTTVATDPSGNVYLLGRTNSFDYPRTRGVFGEVFNSGATLLTVTKISPDGSTILYSTNLRDSGPVVGSGIGVDFLGNAFVTGTVTTAVTLTNPAPDPVQPTVLISAGAIPTTGNAIRGAYTSPFGTAGPEAVTQDGFLMILNADATAQVLSTYIGGDLDEGVFAPYVDRGGDVWVFGWADTWRFYRVFSSTGTPTDHIPNGRNGGLGAGFITQFAFKQGPEPGSAVGTLVQPGYFFSGFGETGFNMQYKRDGFLLRFRETSPLIASFTLAPTQVAGGDPAGLGNAPFSTGTVTLNGPAPTGGATLQLTLNNGNAASFLSTSNAASSTLVIPAGSTVGSFQVFGRQVTSNTAVQVRVSYGGNVRIATVTVVPWLNNVTVTGTTIIGGNNTSGTVRLNAAAPAGGVTVAVSTDRADVVTFPNGGTVTVPAGATQANFPINTSGVDTAQSTKIIASLLGVSSQADLTVTAARLNRVVLTPATVSAGSTSSGVVVLDGQAGSPQTINLAIQGNPAGYTITPSQVVIPAGATQSPAFIVQTPFENATVGRTIIATRVNGANTVIDGPVTGTLSVNAVAVQSIALAPTEVESGGISRATVRLTSAPQSPTIVNLETGNPGVAIPIDANGVPISQIVVPANSDTVAFDVRALFSLNGDTPVPIRAFRAPNRSDLQSATLTVRALTYTLTITPNRVFGGTTVNGLITLSAPAIAGFSMPVTCSDPSISFTQPTFTVGSTTAPFTINTSELTVSKTVLFSTSVGTLPVSSASLDILATEVTGVRVVPVNRVRQGGRVVIEVTVNRNVLVATPGFLTFSNPTLVGPLTGGRANFVIPAGSNRTQIVLNANRVPRDLSATVTAALTTAPGAATASTTVVVIR